MPEAPVFSHRKVKSATRKKNFLLHEIERVKTLWGKGCIFYLAYFTPGTKNRGLLVFDEPSLIFKRVFDSIHSYIHPLRASHLSLGWFIRLFFLEIYYLEKGVTIEAEWKYVKYTLIHIDKCGFKFVKKQLKLSFFIRQEWFLLWNS